MTDTEMGAFYGSLLFAELNGRVPGSEQECSDWLAAMPHIPDSFRLYNDTAHEFITGIIDDHMADVPRIEALRSMGFLLGLHRSGKSWEESEKLATEYIKSAAGGAAHSTRRHDTNSLTTTV